MRFGGWLSAGCESLELGEQMLGPAYLRLWSHFVNRAICQHVTLRLNIVHAECIEQFSFAARGEFT